MSSLKTSTGSGSNLDRSSDKTQEVISPGTASRTVSIT